MSEYDGNSETKLKKETNIKSKCPNCGSELKFLAGTTKMECISCGSQFEIESLGTGKLDEEETDFIKTIEQLKKESSEKVSQRVIHCEDCGGLITLNSKTVSTFCPFCGSHRTIEEDKTDDVIKINGVIPFIIDEKTVRQSFNQWIQKRPFAPGKFKKGKSSPAYSAFYIPFYTFDSITASSWTAKRGDYYYVTRTVGTGKNRHTVTERHTRWTNVSGHINKNFDDVLVRGTSNVLNRYIDEIKEFDFSKMQKYQEEFLLGYYAEKPSISLNDGFQVAKEDMIQNLRQIGISRIGGDTYSSFSIKTNFSNVTFKEIMVPMYNGNYRYKDKQYKFVVNGQSGKFSGNYPISPLKVTSLVIFILIIVAVLVYIIIRGNS